MSRQNDFTRALVMKKILFKKGYVTILDIQKQFEISYTRASYTMKTLRELLDEEGIEYTYEHGVLTLKTAVAAEEAKKEEAVDEEEKIREEVEKLLNAQPTNE